MQGIATDIPLRYLTRQIVSIYGVDKTSNTRAMVLI